MYTYSIMPLKPEFDSYFDEICADVKEQYDKGITTCALFRMTLVPEGNPVTDKVGPLCAAYRRYRKKLSAEGVSTGILIQASLGHGYTLDPNPFTRYKNLTNGKEEFVCCPLDEDFLDHFCDVLRQIAEEHPDAIMLDDDFRMAIRPGRGCVCELHMKELARRIGRSMTREELYAHLCQSPDDDPVTVAFNQMQTDTLIAAAKRFRAAIDAVDPKIQGVNCTSGDACDSVVYTSKIFAGKGNPSIVRVPNGTYAPLTVRRFSETMRNAVVRIAKVKKHGVDVVIAETDTVPFNRYGKNARYLHAHYAASMLDGYKGSKHWITRFAAYEPASGRAFRDILAEHAGMYNEIARLADNVKFVGVGSYFMVQEYPSYRNENFRFYHENEWICSVIERLGIPFYFTEKNDGAVFLESDIVNDMTDEQIENVFSGSVFCDAQSAADLVRRGYGDKLGVSVSPWPGDLIDSESFSGDIACLCQHQKNACLLTVTSDKTEVLSYNCNFNGGTPNMIAPAVTKLSRPDGISVVFCGTPKARFSYDEGFSFLNETRKKQLVTLLREAGALPVYYPGDAEILMRAGYLTDGGLLTAIWNIGFDPLEVLDLSLQNAPSKISAMTKDGSMIPVEFTDKGDGIYAVSVRVEPMYPVILIIE